MRCGNSEQLVLALAVGKVKGQFGFPSTVPSGFFFFSFAGFPFSSLT